MLLIYLICASAIWATTFSYPSNDYVDYPPPFPLLFYDGWFDDDTEVADDTTEGRRCGSTIDGTRGVCTAVTDCSVAKHSIIRYHRHNLERCGFMDRMEIVCCPDESTHNVHVTDREFGGRTPRSTTTTTTSYNEAREKRPNYFSRKSVEACEEYSNEVPPSVTYQILGGENARIGEFPHMAALGYRNNDSSELRWDCGGSLISDRYILTAAHCVKTRSGEEPIKVRLGKVDLKGNSDNAQAQDFNIDDLIPHPDYVRKSRYNDIALIKLNKRVTNTDYIHPACLYTKDNDPTGLIVTGWGATELGGTGSNILQKVTLNPVALSECNSTYFKRISRSILNTQLCARSDDGSQDSCQGDSGGPMQIQQKRESSIYSIVGVTSFGIGCGGPPGVYTRIYSYLDWIEDIVWP